MTFRSRFARLVGLEVGDKTTGEAVGTEVGVRVGLDEIGAVDVVVTGAVSGVLIHSTNSS